MCYPLMTHKVLCLGLVHNHAPRTLSDVRLKARTRQANGETNVQTFALAQQRLAPGDSAPYHLVLDDAAQVSSLAVYVLDAPTAADDALSPYRVVVEWGELVPGGDYHLGVRLWRTPSRSAGLVTPPRLVVTLLDERQRVVGYRVWRLADALAPGERRRLRLRLLSQVSEARITPKVWVEPS